MGLNVNQNEKPAGRRRANERYCWPARPLWPERSRSRATPPAAEQLIGQPAGRPADLRATTRRHCLASSPSGAERARPMEQSERVALALCVAQWPVMSHLELECSSESRAPAELRRRRRRRRRRPLFGRRWHKTKDGTNRFEWKPNAPAARLPSGGRALAERTIELISIHSNSRAVAAAAARGKSHSAASSYSSSSSPLARSLACSLEAPKGRPIAQHKLAREATSWRPTKRAN